MDAYNRRTNLEKKTLPIALPYMFEAENFSDHPRTYMEVTDLIYTYTKTINEKKTGMNTTNAIRTMNLMTSNKCHNQW